MIPDTPTPPRLSVTNGSTSSKSGQDFKVPLPAHAQPKAASSHEPFAVNSSRQSSPRKPATEQGRAEYLLPEIEKKELLLPESANLNLPKDTELVAIDTGERIILPAGTYRQILKFPIDSPMMKEWIQSRDLTTSTVETDTTKSRYAAPPSDPIWVRYESLEKIKVGDTDRRGGLDVPSHGPKNLGPRVWYAKSEAADLASSAFYFLFGGLGYGIANLAGWSAGNTREVANDFEYRLLPR